jgi:hypothetical protein
LIALLQSFRGGLVKDLAPAGLLAVWSVFAGRQDVRIEDL